MSSLERVVERLVKVRTVECPRCKLEGKTVRATVKKRKGKYCKTAKCPACGHRINTGFAEQYVDVKKVSVKRLLHPLDMLMPEQLIKRRE